LKATSAASAIRRLATSDARSAASQDKSAAKRSGGIDRFIAQRLGATAPYPGRSRMAEEVMRRETPAMSQWSGASA
jgi:hypothetical protein